jgi:hypothetical protein
MSVGVMEDYKQRGLRVKGGKSCFGKDEKILLKDKDEVTTNEKFAV